MISQLHTQYIPKRAPLYIKRNIVSVILYNPKKKHYTQVILVNINWEVLGQVSV